MSLEILNPPKLTPVKPDATDEPKESDILSRKESKCPICGNAGPEELSRRMVQIFNDKDFHNPLLSHVTRAFKSEEDIIPSENSEEYLRQRRQWTLDYPEYHLEVLQAVAHIDEIEDKAKVEMALEVTGHPPGVRKQSLSVMHWRRRRGEWYYFRREAVRGLPWF